MFILAGFTSPAADAVPHILYIGDDGEECDRIAEASDFPRIARLRNPQWQPLRHWSEEAAEAFAKKQTNTTPAGTAQAVRSDEGEGAPAAPEPQPLPAPPASETAATDEQSEVAADTADDEETPLLPGGPRKRR